MSVAVLLRAYGAGAPTSAGAFTGGGVTLNQDGSCSGTAYTGPAWFSVRQAGIGNAWYFRLTRTSGTGGVVFNQTAGVWIRITAAGASVTAVGGVGGCAGTIEFSRDNGASVASTNSISVNNTL